MQPWHCGILQNEEYFMVVEPQLEYACRHFRGRSVSRDVHITWAELSELMKSLNVEDEVGTP